VAFIRHGAIQCGFCTPGMIMAAKGLLNTNLHPGGEDIKKYLKGNLCRCTGYQSIVAAIQEAARIMRGETEASLEAAFDVCSEVSLSGKSSSYPF
jgi:aerobic-type carbon monoxide dehydrogenase small subunit (CoxS/CutS family)